MLVNMHIKVVHNNIFITMTDFEGNTSMVTSAGSLEFSNKNSKVSEIFSALLEKNIELVHFSNYKLNTLNLVNFPKLSLKLMKKLLTPKVELFNRPNWIPKYKFIEKTNHNGCRMKKSKRKRVKLKFKKFKQLQLI